ncbi:MAG TPA: glycolate oxidase subunit GlcF [Alphaproteobacteria bacterium]|nr:glycolate oxidase subunit GlcF [Alphaproteobacteria bacterium]
MQTQFTLAQLADPAIRESNAILRACVHCGFCTATCPTYVVLGDERDSPRGRIYMIKNMLESGATADPATVTHIDRCLTCLSCMTTCPAGVDYMHLVGHARTHIAQTYRRPLRDRLLRAALNWLLPHPERFRSALQLGAIVRPIAGLTYGRLRSLFDLLPTKANTKPSQTGGVFPPSGAHTGRVALLHGCVQPTLRPQINEAAIRLLNRRGIEVVIAEGAGCCGALSHQLSEDADAVRFAKANIDAWTREIENGGLDAIIVTASGCGTMIKDYRHLLSRDPAYAEKAKIVSSRATDISEFLAEIGLGRQVQPRGLEIAYHSACSLQHGQRVNEEPRELLRSAGFNVREITEGHLCCGSAGLYNMLESEISNELLRRKTDNIERTGADAIATGNIGCITQIARATDIPIVHTVELLDWATGGPAPSELWRLR